MKQNLICNSLCHSALCAEEDGLNLLSITDRTADKHAICHLLLQSELPHHIVRENRFSLTQKRTKAAFSQRLFSDYDRFLADCSILDTLHEKYPILVRKVESARPLLFSLVTPPHTHQANMGALREFDGVLQCRFANCDRILLFAWKGDADWNGETICIRGSATLAFGFCAMQDFDKTLCRMALLHTTKEASDAITPFDACMALLAARMLPNGTIVPFLHDTADQSDLQANVLLSLCRIANRTPKAKELAKHVYHGLQISSASPQAALCVLAAITYCEQMQLPIPDRCASVLCASTPLLLSGAMPFAVCDALPYPYCEHGSLARTVQWLSATHMLLSLGAGGNHTVLLQEKAGVVQLMLAENFSRGDVWLSASLKRAMRLRKAHSRMGICPICHDRIGDSTAQILHYDKRRNTYLCPLCKQSEWELPPLSFPPVYDTYGYCPLPTLSTSNSLNDLVATVFCYREKEAEKELRSRLHQEPIDALSSHSLSLLCELFLS